MATFYPDLIDPTVIRGKYCQLPGPPVIVLSRQGTVLLTVVIPAGGERGGDDIEPWLTPDPAADPNMMRT